jgi:hypothetical protein
MYHKVKKKLHSHVKSRGSANIKGRVTGTTEVLALVIGEKRQSKVNHRQNIEQRRTSNVH